MPFLCLDTQDKYIINVWVKSSFLSLFNNNFIDLSNWPVSKKLEGYHKLFSLYTFFFRNSLIGITIQLFVDPKSGNYK
jgi:hypothetical protein